MHLEITSEIFQVGGAGYTASEDAAIYLNRGLIRELSGDLEGACADWSRAKELGAEDADAYLKECNK